MGCGPLLRQDISRRPSPCFELSSLSYSRLLFVIILLACFGPNVDQSGISRQVRSASTTSFKFRNRCTLLNQHLGLAAPLFFLLGSMGISEAINGEGLAAGFRLITLLQDNAFAGQKKNHLRDKARDQYHPMPGNYSRCLRRESHYKSIWRRL